MKKTLAIFIAGMMLSAILTGCSDAKSSSYSGDDYSQNIADSNVETTGYGNLTISCGDQSITPKSYVMCVVKNGVQNNYDRNALAKMTDLPKLTASGDDVFTFTIDGKTCKTNHYTLYTSNYHSTGSPATEFTMPTETGTYYGSVTIAWGDNIDNFTELDYFFTFDYTA